MSRPIPAGCIKSRDHRYAWGMASSGELRRFAERNRIHPLRLSRSFSVWRVADIEKLIEDRLRRLREVRRSVRRAARKAAK